MSRVVVFTGNGGKGMSGGQATLVGVLAGALCGVIGYGARVLHVKIKAKIAEKKAAKQST